MAETLAKGVRVLFREGRYEHVGTVLGVEPDGMVLVGTKKRRVGTDDEPAGTWEAKLIPANLLQVMPKD